jgi:CBS domain containing-hemolysin-like protein
MTTLILFFSLAVIISFVCSLSEAGLLSLRRTDIVKLKEAGIWGAGILERLKSNVERALAGILTVNTLANCFGAAGVGTAAAAIWGTSGMATASAVLTVTILIFSEIIPKTLGANYPVRLANVIAVAVQSILFITYPIVLLMGQVSRLLGSGQDKFSREDVLLAAQVGVSDGVIQEREAEVISKWLNRIGSTVQASFTTADRVTTFSRDQTVEEVCQKPDLLAHSRFPVVGERPDEIIGIVRQDQILKKVQEGERNCRLGDIAEPALTVREHDTLEEAVMLMRQEMSKMALVTDAQGRYLGVLSVGDLLKHLFGSEVADIA